MRRAIADRCPVAGMRDRRADAAGCRCHDSWGKDLDDCMKDVPVPDAREREWEETPLTDLFVKWANFDARPASEGGSTTVDRKQMQRRVDLRFEVVPTVDVGRMESGDDASER